MGSQVVDNAVCLGFSLVTRDKTELSVCVGRAERVLVYERQGSNTFSTEQFSHLTIDSTGPDEPDVCSGEALLVGASYTFLSVCDPLVRGRLHASCSDDPPVLQP